MFSPSATCFSSAKRLVAKTNMQAIGKHREADWDMYE